MPSLIARPKVSTIADLIAALGDVTLDRVRLDPSPGKATERDLIRLQAKDDRLYELVDGTLVENALVADRGKNKRRRKK